MQQRCSEAGDAGRRLRVGLISDTHSLLRPEAAALLQGCDLIIHAGDICDAIVLDDLRAIAPTVAVRGNNDRGPWADKLRASETVKVGGVLIYVVHDIADLSKDPAAAEADIVVTGHSHKPLVERRAGVLFINPGSAGPRRFKLPISACELVIEDKVAVPRLVELVAV